ncbi:hypothetical protein [Chitiniphilus shinanonensis]|uniref:hypothetical protein n=1 Tax=Chitiniphilus shinanonensis TaxID=553088 RepID=UPI00333EE0A7
MKLSFFFRGLLFLPFLAPLLLLPFGMSSVLGVLLFSLSFGGWEYLLFATFLFFLIGRIGDVKKMLRILYFSPLMFLPVVSIGWVVEGYVERIYNPDLSGIWGGLIPIIVYTMLIGYFYVILAFLIYWVFRKLNWIYVGS